MNEQQSSATIRDSDVAAPLKLGGSASVTIKGYTIRDSDVAAPLKPGYGGA